MLRHTVYEVDRLPQLDLTTPPPTNDAFEIRTADGTSVKVDLALEPNDCDRFAGARLDPQGVGFEVFANEIDPEKALTACRTATETYPQVGRFHYQLGRALLADRQIEKAKDAYARAAELGHIRAHHAMGQVLAAFSATTGVASQDALAYYQRGVAAGDPYAFHALGKQLLRFGKTEAERRRGFELLQKAVETGHTYSMNELGVYYLDESNPEYDPARGIRFFQESAARNDIYGYNNMALAYRDGRGDLPVDLDKAEEFFIKAVDGKHPTAPRFLGLLYVEGKLNSSNPDVEAVKQFDIGLSRGDAWSGVNGAWTILNRQVPGLTPVDAGTRAIKTLSLPAATDTIARAEGYLADLSSRDVAAAMQIVMNETSRLLAERGDAHPDILDVDGAFGAGSRAALASLAESLSVDMPTGEDTLDMARAVSRVYWSAAGRRIDVE